jgi:hypothetical protein
MGNSGSPLQPTTGSRVVADEAPDNLSPMLILRFGYARR